MRGLQASVKVLSDHDEYSGDVDEEEEEEEELRDAVCLTFPPTCLRVTTRPFIRSMTYME